MLFSAPDGEDVRLTQCLSAPWGEELIVLDAAGRLFRLVRLKRGEKQIDGRPVVGTAEALATRVLAAALVGSRLVYVGIESPSESHHVISIGTDVARASIPFEGQPTRAFFGPPAGAGHEKFGLLAFELGEFQWAVLSAKGEELLARPHGATVVGVLTVEGRVATTKEPGLLALEDDGRTLTLHGRSWRQKVLESSSRIERVTVSTAAPRIAYSTEAGEVVVYSLQHRADLCRYQQGVGP
jgi:hypothetical protein